MTNRPQSVHLHTTRQSDKGVVINEETGSGQAIKVLQITDTHLFDDPDGCLLGLNTEQSLQAVIEDAGSRHLPADLVLATGDLAHEASTTAAYQRTFSHLEKLGLPVYCLPGNHDEKQLLESATANGPCQYTDHLLQGNWHFVFLDSTIPDSEGAHLSPASLQKFDGQLQSSPDTHALVCLHHQPVPMGSHWLDTMALDNPDDFFAVIDKHPQVRGIIWGHVHQEFTDIRNGVRLISTPSTCIQFKPNSNEFTLDTQAPGYRWLLLQPDGKIETGVERLDSIPGTIDLAASGY